MWVRLWLVGLLLGAEPPVADTILLVNGSGEEVVLMVKGTLNGAYTNDQHYFRPNGNRISIDNFTASDRVNEVIAFTRGRPVAIRTDVKWTPGPDVVTVTFAEEIQLPITVWILQKPFALHRDRALAGRRNAEEVWFNERTGLAIRAFDIRDATDNPNTGKYLDFSCERDLEGMQRQIGRVDGRINAYYVDKVHGDPAGAEACRLGSAVAVLGSRTIPAVLAHEFGHNFFLSDLIMQDGNVMDNFLFGKRLYGGQVFRMHFSPESVLNYLYLSRPGQPQRSCTDDQRDDECPDRFWPGVYEP